MTRTILVTGGAGFIGTNFVRHALDVRPDWRILNLDLLTYAGNPENFKSLPAEHAGRHRLIQGDIRDRALLERLFDEESPDGVIHFAAESHVDRSILGPEAFVETNVVGTFRLLEAALSHWKSCTEPDALRFVHVSTDEVYGSLEAQAPRFRETTPYDPSSPYSASKAASDHFARAYGRTYGLPVLITNCSNNYGPFQHPEKLIPLAILNLVKGEPVPLYGDGKNVRDWLHVLDHCKALIRVFEGGTPGETYNIGGDAERTNLELVRVLRDLVFERIGRPRSADENEGIRFVRDRPGHDRRYAVDASKIRNELGWRPAHGIEEGLRMTVDWYLANGDWIDSARSRGFDRWMERNYSDRSKEERRP